MIITNELDQRVEITTARTMQRVALFVEPIDGSDRRPQREFMYVTVGEARVLRDLLTAMNLGPA